jgi:hypothetical protein
MTKFINDPFAACSAKPKKRSARAGRHTKASQELQNGRSQKEERIMVPTNSENQKLVKRANIVTRYFNKNMKTKLEKKREVYYNHAEGIELSYPTGSEQRNLTELDIVYDIKNNKIFNVFIGVDRKNNTKSTFIVLMVSKEKKAIAPDKMESRSNEAMKGVLENKPSVKRGAFRRV